MSQIREIGDVDAKKILELNQLLVVSHLLLTVHERGLQSLLPSEAIFASEGLMRRASGLIDQLGPTLRSRSAMLHRLSSSRRMAASLKLKLRRANKRSPLSRVSKTDAISAVSVSA